MNLYQPSDIFATFNEQQQYAMHISTLPFFRFRRVGGRPSPLLLLLAVLFSLCCTDSFGQCRNCTRTITLPFSGRIDVGARERVCLVNNSDALITYGGQITLANNSTLCIGPNIGLNRSPILSANSGSITIINYGLWDKALNLGAARIDSIVNYGVMNINAFTINNNATFSNYGGLTIEGDLIIANGSNRFNNRGAGEVLITGNVEVRGNGNNNGFFHSGANVTVLGDFNVIDQNANVDIRGLLSVRDLSIQGGNVSVVKTIVTVNGNYTQDGSNTRVSGGTPATNCGSFSVSGTSRLDNGTFGFSGFLGMCDLNGDDEGGFDTAAPGTVRIPNNPNNPNQPNGNLRCSCNQILPITLMYFTAKQNDSQVVLQWATASEKDNEYFSLEKSRDGRQFNEIGRVAGAGTSTTKLTYQFTDDFPFGGTSYYRLKQVDLDGTFTYSRIVAVNSEVTAALRIYPNPVTQNELWVEATDAQADDMRITIHNAVGQLLLDRVYSYEPAVKVDLSALRREPGLYIISVRRKSRIERQKLVIR
jgi:hypothetical protein